MCQAALGQLGEVPSVPDEAGERCDACEAVLSLDQLLIEVTTVGQMLLQLHVRCFELWKLEKQGVPGYSSYSG